MSISFNNCNKKTLSSVVKDAEAFAVIDLFKNSKLMITDCCTFLTEYFATGNPLIRLVSKDGAEFNTNVLEIIKNYYNVNNNTELENTLNELLVNNNDTLKEQRKLASKQFKQNATENIINDLLEQLS